MRKKGSRMRGSKTHGGGSMKKRRGAGHRGGKGRAGSGKRGDARKPVYWKNKRFYSGKYGFKVPGKKSARVNCLNIGELENQLPTLIQRGVAVEKGGIISLDLDQAGYHKLLSRGKPTKKLNLATRYASQKAVDKISKAGGKVTVKSPQNQEQQRPQKGKGSPAKEKPE